MARMPSRVQLHRVLLATGLATGLLAACSGSGNSRKDPTCEEDATHCDLPHDPAEVSCTRRRDDAFNENRLSFNTTFLRWSCADVQGVTEDDRGQEYCEYFAVAKLPADGTLPAPEPVVLGRNLGKDSSFGTTTASVELSAKQITALEADETKVVGSCMFTSWNSDIPGPVPACDGTDPTACPKIAGLPVDETFRMSFKVNSMDAGQLLVDDCFTNPTAGNPKYPTDARHDDFMRGCLWNADINGTEFRKSDTTICSSMTRLSECGCTVSGNVALAELISPTNARGFQLGGWSGFVAGNETSTLPANCHYVHLGDNSQTLVACDLTAGDLLYGAADVKSYCQEKYADSIVVHVPVPADKISCDPSQSDSPYAATCSSTPWILEPASPSGS